MAGMSKYLALALFNMSLNPVRAAYTPPDGLWLALHTAPPSDSTYGNEVTFAGYVRQPVNSLTAETGPEDADGNVNVVVKNGSAIVFPQSTSDFSQIITHWAIWDSEATGSGNVLYSGSLGVPRMISNGDAVAIPEGNLALTLK